MMKLFCMEIEVGDARPLSFFSDSSVEPASAFFFGDLPTFLVVFLDGLLEVNLDGEPYDPTLVGD